MGPSSPRFLNLFGTLRLSVTLGKLTPLAWDSMIDNVTSPGSRPYW